MWEEGLKIGKRRAGARSEEKGAMAWRREEAW